MDNYFLVFLSALVTLWLTDRTQSSALSALASCGRQK